MPAAENTGDHTPRARKTRPIGLTLGEAYIGERLDDVVDELRALREKAPSPKLLISGLLGGVMIVFGIQAATTLFLSSGLLQTRGVDVTIAAEATKKVVAAGAEAGSPVTTTTTTTETVVAPEPAAPVEP